MKGDDFRDAVYENYYPPKKFHFYLSQEQVSVFSILDTPHVKLSGACYMIDIR
jgi:hypothetical protein